MLYLLHQIVDRSADRYPDRDAFCYGSDALSYRALAQRANGLAGTLHDEGVKAGDRVGVLMPKCLEMPIAVFGVLKAGAVMVPLDTQTPVGRLVQIIRSAGIRQLITTPDQLRLLKALLATADSPVNLIIGIEPAAELPCRTLAWHSVASSGQAPDVARVEDDPAYLLFTSGSTGQPKGILHSHRSGLAYARLSADTYGVRPEDRLGSFAPLHFDQSTFDFYTGLLCGATIVLIPRAFAVATASLAALMEEAALTIWYSVPSVLVQLVLQDALADRDLSALRWVLFGGEAFPLKHLEKLMSLAPNARFSNVYGPTEVNQCTFYHLTGQTPLTEALPIGRVWPNTEALILGDDDSPVAPGEPGELLIRSPTMMLGYWQQPELNERAFFYRTRDSGVRDRFYRTGDLVRAGSDGNLEFLGRKDRQIKTRGYRVELDEIEHLLNLHESVEEAATYTVEALREGLLIEAAVIASEGARLSQKDLAKNLIRHLARHLPPYARPRRVIVLDEFPRTRTGKIDRNALSRLPDAG